MIITLINPPALVARYNYSTLSHPPLGLAYIAAFLEQQDHDVCIIDAIGSAIDRFSAYEQAPGFFVQGLSVENIVSRIDPRSRIIGFSCLFTHAWPFVRELIAAVRRAVPQAFLVAGGEHATAMADVCLAQSPLDLCVLGEGEVTMAAVAHALEKGLPLESVPGIVYRDRGTGRIMHTPRRARIRNLSRLPRPAWHRVSPHVYRVYEGAATGPTMPMVGSRGCPFKCRFCAAPNMWGHCWKKREPADIVDEMEDYAKRFGTREFQFFDISPFLSKPWTKALCREIIDRGLKTAWQAPAGVRAEVIDQQVAGLLVASGHTRIQFALESGSPAVRKAVNKKMDIARFEAGLTAALSAGMKVCVLFIIGYPGETLSDVRMTCKSIRQMAAKGVHEIAISTFVPLPGTAIFDELHKNGQLEINDNYCLKMADATALTHATSWNPLFSNRHLLLFKWLGILQFYGLSFLLHPSRGLRTLRNLIRGVQESKTDRAIAEIRQKLAIRLSEKNGGNDSLLSYKTLPGFCSTLCKKNSPIIVDKTKNTLMT